MSLDDSGASRMGRVTLRWLLFAACLDPSLILDRANGQDQRPSQLNLAELEGDVQILLTLDAAGGRKTPEGRSQYLKQLLTQARERKRWYGTMLLKFEQNQGNPEVMAKFREHYHKQFRVALYRTLLETRFQSADEYRKLDERNARLVRLACLMRHHKVSTIKELQIILREEYNSSLAHQQDAYLEQEFGKARPW